MVFATSASCCATGILHHRNPPFGLTSKIPAMCEDGWSNSILLSGGKLKGSMGLSSGSMRQASVLSTRQVPLMHLKGKRR